MRNFYQTRLGEYPSLCNICADYMKEQREKRRMEVRERNMDSKTRMEVLPCGKCEDMIGCDNCLFQKEAKELYKQIRADAN